MRNLGAVAHFAQLVAVYHIPLVTRTSKAWEMNHGDLPNRVTTSWLIVSFSESELAPFSVLTGGGREETG
jgi:hypothetical protein